MLSPAEQTYADKILALEAENARLRALLVELLRIVKEVEINLQNALDKDHE